ncbi:MAG: sulfatase-like hydrolase/transferase [Candidatus Aminicenantes bacterium]|jgi:arylsulfatase A-like enzyme
MRNIPFFASPYLRPIRSISVILMFFILFFCLDCKRERAPEFEVYRLIDHLDRANILLSPYKNFVDSDEEFQKAFPEKSFPLQDLGVDKNPFTLNRKLKLGGREMNVILSPPQSQYRFDIDLDEGTVLDFGIGILREYRPGEAIQKSREEKGVNFMIVLETAGKKRTVFQHYLSPPPIEDKETVSFQRHRLDLPLAKSISLSLVIEGDSANMAFWYNPVLFQKGKSGINVILISVDTLRADHLGCYGYERETSPNIDALAEDSVLFSNVYASSPWTLPSHVSMLTSLHGVHHQVYQDDERMDPAILTLADLLRQNHFFCTAFTGGGFVSSVYGFSKGFDMYQEGGGGVHRQDSAGYLYGLVVEWLEQHSKDKNFFLFLHTYQPHDPYACPEPFKDMFLSEDAKWSHINLMGHLGGRPNLFKPLPELERRNIVDLYDGELRYTDEALIGPLLEKLKQLGLYDRTLIVFTSDHGEEFYDHKSWGHGHQLYDESLKVPLLMKFPGARLRGTKIDNIVSLVDVMPTILEELGIDCLELSLDGKSLIPAIKGKDREDRIFWADIGDNVLDSHVPQKISTNSGTEKFILNKRYTEEALTFFDYPPPETGPAELYDLIKDPREERNIVDNRVELVNQLIRSIELLYSQAKKRKSLKPEIDEDLKEQLRALGYIK